LAAFYLGPTPVCWLLHNNFYQAEGVTNLEKVPEAGALITIEFAKSEG